MDLTLEALERLQLRGAALTPDILGSARRSFNLVFARWTNLGVNLWRVSEEPVSVFLVQGTSTYDVDPSVISILPEAVIRQYSMFAAENYAPSFTTVITSQIVTVNKIAHGYGPGQIVGFTVPVAVAGLVIQNFYRVVATPTADTFTIDAGSIALATTTGGVVPLFTTYDGSAVVNVDLVNHGYRTGDAFVIQVATDVGGLTLSNQYVVTASLTNNTFTFNAGVTATSDDSAYENDGLTQITASDPTALPVDRVVTPLSRADYSAIPVKAQEGFPTSYWFNRQISPSVTIWQIPDNTGPYELRYYALYQPEDANLQAFETPDVPYRGLEALASAVAAHMAMKWRPELFDKLTAYAQQMWMEFADADREKVSFYLAPMLTGY